MRRFCLLLAVAALLAPSTRAQSTLDVQACVEDEDDGAGLEGAWVRAYQEGGGAVGDEGTTGPDGCVWLAVPVVVGSEDTLGDTTGLMVSRVYPNPAAHEARVDVRLGRRQAVTWRLYDLLGRLVRGPETVALTEGRHTLSVPLDGLPDGRYLYRIVGPGGAAGGAVVKASAAGTGGASGPGALTAAPLLAFEGWRIGYDTLRTVREVADGETVRLSLAKMRGPGRPIVDMVPGETYLGFEGGLYPGASNAPPARHRDAGVARGQAVVPRDLAGNPHPGGRYVLLSVGFSNNTQEFCGHGKEGGPPCRSWSFVGQAHADPAVNSTTLMLVDGAYPGASAEDWVSAASPEYDRVRDEVLAPKGLSEAQVQVVWLKVANPEPTVSLPDPDAEAYRLVGQYGQILRALKERYPNLQQVFFSSRNWGGFAVTDLHPEPFAYEAGYAVKWTVAAQIAQMDGGGVDPRAGDLDYNTVAPWVAWGPYFWAEGLRPRNDGLFWEPDDFQSDGTHPARSAEEKVGTRLLAFFRASPYTRCWFVTGGTCGE
jgi:hypothetical protein